MDSMGSPSHLPTLSLSSPLMVDCLDLIYCDVGSNHMSEDLDIHHCKSKPHIPNCKKLINPEIYDMNTITYQNKILALLDL